MIRVYYIHKCLFKGVSKMARDFNNQLTISKVYHSTNSYSVQFFKKSGINHLDISTKGYFKSLNIIDKILFLFTKDEWNEDEQSGVSSVRFLILKKVSNSRVINIPLNSLLYVKTVNYSRGYSGNSFKKITVKLTSGETITVRGDIINFRIDERDNTTELINGLKDLLESSSIRIIHREFR